MAKILMIVAQSGFRDEELLVPREVLERAGHDVKVASISRAKAKGVKGLVITPDMAVYEANPEFFDCVVVVGGPGSPTLADDKDVTGLLLAAAGKGRLIGGICLGPMALAKAGVLAGKNATVFPDRKAINLLKETAAYYKAEPIVIDGKVVTADGPQSAGKFGAELVSMLQKKR
jgi:protease I